MSARILPWFILAAAACSHAPDGTAAGPASPASTTPGPVDAGAPDTDPFASGPAYGARLHVNGDLEVRVRAPNATRLELCVFAAAFGSPETLRLPMDRAKDTFSIRVDASRLPPGTIFYGLRAYGPNWTYDASFVPGSHAGFVADVDAAGNRMNPNKLLLDPYALEISHDPITTTYDDGSVYRTGDGNRDKDSGPFAPKGVVIPTLPIRADGPTAALRDDVIYEVQVRGLTMADPNVPQAQRGTYAGAATRAKYLHDLGVTAIEMMPIAETPNDQNDRNPGDDSGDNYWGYSTLAFFAPDRRFSSDKSPGGPTRELRAMVDAFHAAGVKVFVDVVYNHTAESGVSGGNATLYGFRGLDAATYYELADDATANVNDNGVGANVNTANPIVADVVVDSLAWWHGALGVDGFRFDLAPVVGNSCTRGCYKFDPAGLLTRIATDLPARSADGGAGVDLVAEPWGVASGTYQIGAFPAGWSEWNDHFRDAVRRDLNRNGVTAVTPREITTRLAGSPDLFNHDGRAPAASIDYVASHDGMTLADLFAYDAKNNAQAFPYGPSSGGASDDISWGHGGDAAKQRGSTRAALALAALAAGVPMITGGDERLRTIRGNDNSYNLDTTATWLDWTPNTDADAFAAFTSKIFAFRHAESALRPASFATSATWLRADAQVADGTYLDDASQDFVGMLAGAIYAAYSGSPSAITVTLPAAPSSQAWHLAFDTSPAAEAWGNAVDPSTSAAADATYALAARTVAIFVAR